MQDAPLLDKVRHVCRVVQSSADHALDFQKGAEMLGEVIKANFIIVSTSGKILGYTLMDDFHCDLFNQQVLDDGEFPQWYNEKFLLASEESRVNLAQKGKYCIYFSEEEQVECKSPNILTTVIPIMGGGKRLGTLVIHRYGEELSTDDLVLAENGATIIGMEIMRGEVEKREKEMRHRAIAEVAFDSLSYSELEAIEEIFKELNGQEGIIVASKIADSLGITRSVIVNALRKFESAGVIDSRSLGMKGTFIRVKHPLYMEEIEKRIQSDSSPAF